MIKVSKHVRDTIHQSPFLEEILSEDIANLSAVAKLIHADVQKKAKGTISVQSVTMALSRLKISQHKNRYGLQFLKHMESIKVQTDMTLLIYKNEQREEFENTLNRNAIVYVSKVTGSNETLFIFTQNDNVAQYVRSAAVCFTDVTSLTLTLPKSSIRVPGVYYPILKKLSWNGINIIELVSVGQELTFYVQKKDTDQAFLLLNSFRT